MYDSVQLDLAAGLLVQPAPRVVNGLDYLDVYLPAVIHVGPLLFLLMMEVWFKELTVLSATNAL